MTNKAALFALSIQYSSLTIIVMMSSINEPIDASLSLMSTDNWSAVVRWLADFCLFSCGSKDRCGEFISSVSQYSSRSRSFPSSIAASLTVVYSAGVGVVPKGNLRQIKASLSTIAMHVDAFFAFACIQRQAASRSVFSNKFSFCWPSALHC